MSHPSIHAQQSPDRLAAIFVPGNRAITYRELEEGANRAANALQAAGVKAGDTVVFCLGNNPHFLFLAWGCQRIGVLYVPTSMKLGADDLAYICRDSDAKAVIVSADAECAKGLASVDFGNAQLWSVGQDISRASRWEAIASASPATLPRETSRGREMMYSSGTTGRPKGVRKPLQSGGFADADTRDSSWKGRQGVGQSMVMLCTSPLYHAAPHRNVAATLAFGGICVIMENFDAVLCLQSIARFEVTHSIWVPTMFHRLLRLPDQLRETFDLSSHLAAYHGAAPCPVHVKEEMIEWWGPILYEYYAGTEGIGACAITSAEWIEHKGSVGRATDGVIHILDEQQNEVPSGVTGTVFFEGAGNFSYWNDPEKTVASKSRQGWWTYGDVGHIDAGGYLYLTDRRDFVINSGGVNIYPQEIEAFLLRDERVLDAAVFGIPDEEYGEAVQAIIQVSVELVHSEGTAKSLRELCRRDLGPLKTPKGIALTADFPRLPNGKLQKQRLRQQFLADGLIQAQIFPASEM